MRVFTAVVEKCNATGLYADATPRFSSGLVEMQRYFSKWREQISSLNETKIDRS